MKNSFCSLAALLALAGQAALPPAAQAGDQTIVNGKSAAAREFLKVHNEARARVGTPPLRWSDALAHRAQQWASQLAASGQFQHSPQTNPKLFGENLYWSSLGFSPAHAARYWLEERVGYCGGPFTAGICSVAGHYTQMVWRRTKEVGYGVATGPKGVVIVGNYSPTGNVIGISPY